LRRTGTPKNSSIQAYKSIGVVPKRFDEPKNFRQSASKAAFFKRAKRFEISPPSFDTEEG